MDNILKIINTIPFKITIDEWYLRYSITMIQNQIKVYHSSSFINSIPQIDDAKNDALQVTKSVETTSSSVQSSAGRERFFRSSLDFF